MGKHAPLTAKERSARYRASQKAKGLRLKRMWVPDLNNPEIVQQIRREWQEIAKSAEEAEVTAWTEAMREEVWGSEPDYDWGDAPEPQC
jgi:hypothetical protein